MERNQAVPSPWTPGQGGHCDAIEEAAQRFEQARRRGERPNLSDYVRGCDADQRALFAALIPIDMEYRMTFDREDPRVEHYVRQFPELAADRDLVLRLISHEARLRRRLEQLDALSGSLTASTPGTTSHAESTINREGGRDLASWLVSHEAKLRGRGDDMSTTAPGAVDEGAEDVVPGVIGRYEVERVLGRGAFGTVYLARDSLLRRPVAIKVPRPERSRARGWVDRFLEEARLTAALKHETIVAVYDFGRCDDGSCYLVLEYVEGRPLSEALREGRLAPERASTLMAEVARAVHHAHTRQLVHGDLKPTNILVDDRGRPHVADFGLAIRDDAGGGAGRVAGTPAYMAPEQVRGERLDGRADVWALGAILYEALTGRTPFAQAGRDDLFAAILHGHPRPPRQLDETIPRELERCCLRCLTPDLGARYTTAADLADDLETWLASAKGTLPPAAHEPTPKGTSEAPAPASSRPRVALIYRRGVQPDEELVTTLEAALGSQGVDVFVDRRLTIGEDWAREIGRRLREADAVVALLSAGSVHSEMLSYEVGLAHQASQKRGGRPKLLPVRVQYQDRLPADLAGVLDRYQYFPWRGPQDDRALVEQVARALAGPAAPTKAEAAWRLDPPFGALALDSHFYIVRGVDAEFRGAIDRRDSIVLLRGARQMGKTSLLARGLRQARASGARVVLTDLQKLNETDLESATTFFQALGEGMAFKLGLKAGPVAGWNPRHGASVNFERFLQREVLARIGAPLVWAIDETDRLFSQSFGSEVFGLFRSWHNERVFESDGPWRDLTLVIAYATEAHLFITDVNQSPFNVGTLLSLEDFSPEQVADLNDRYGAPLRGPEDLGAFCRLLNGHPYLSNRGLYELRTRGLGVAGLEALADRDDGPFGDHLRLILVLLAQDQALYEVVRSVVRGGPAPPFDAFYRLRSAGVLAGDAPGEARPRCQLYADFLRRHLA
jgi:predicted Ser/Thr protein kinase